MEDQLLQRSVELHARFREAGHRLNPRLYDPRREESRQRLQQWREDITLLDVHLGATAQACSALRQQQQQQQQHPGGALPSAVTAEPGETERMAVNDFVMSLKADVRSLHHDGKALLAVANASDATTEGDSVAAQSQAAAWERDIAEMEARLDAVKLARAGEDPVSRAQLVDLIQLRSGLYARVGHALQRFKHKLDVQIGLAEFEASDDAGQRSAATRFFIAAAGNFVELAALARHELRQHERLVLADDEAHRVNVVRRVEKERDLREALAAVSSGRHHGHHHQQQPEETRMDLAQRSLHVLESTHAELNTTNLRLAGSNVQLSETLEQLELANAEAAVRLEREVSHHNPRMQKVEQMVLTTKRAFEALRRDVDLVSGMYQRVSGSFDAVRERMARVNWECGRLADRADAEEAAVRDLQEQVAKAKQSNVHGMTALFKVGEELKGLDARLAQERAAKGKLDGRAAELAGVTERLQAELERSQGDEQMLADRKAALQAKLDEGKLQYRLRSANFDELEARIRDEMPDGLTAVRRQEFQDLREQLYRQQRETQQAEARLLATNNKVFQQEMRRSELRARMRSARLAAATAD